MELYEIVKFTHKPTIREDYFEPEVITATMDKDLAEKMLTIYKSNQKMHESYQIRTVRESEAVLFSAPMRCETCNSYCRCVDTIETHPDTRIRCINFGALYRYIKNEELI